MSKKVNNKKDIYNKIFENAFNEHLNVIKESHVQISKKTQRGFKFDCKVA